MKSIAYWQPRSVQRYFEKRKMDHSVTRRKRFYPIDVSDIPTDSPTFAGTDVPVGYLFRYWDERFALKSFLMDFPEVSPSQALAALRKRAEFDMPVDSTDGLMGGMPVFKGTRVPVEYLFNLLRHGRNVEEFLDQYTTVEREDALRVLEIASEFVEIATYENTPG